MEDDNINQLYSDFIENLEDHMELPRQHQDFIPMDEAGETYYYHTPSKGIWNKANPGEILSPRGEKLFLFDMTQNIWSPVQLAKVEKDTVLDKLKTAYETKDIKEINRMTS